MKKLRSILLTGVFITLNISTTAFANEKIISFKEEAGITPDSMLYPIDKLMEKTSVALKFDEEKKVKILTEIAQERLGESEVMIQEGKQDLVEEALKGYEESINETTDLIDNIIEEVQNIDNEDMLKDETTELTDEELVDIDKEEDKIENLKEELTKQQEQSIEVLGQLQDTVSDEAKVKLEQVLQMQIAKKAAVTNLVEKVHEFNKEKKELNMLKVQLKKSSKTGDEEAIKKAEQDYQLKLNEYNISKENMEEAKEQHKIIVKQNLDEKDRDEDESENQENKQQEQIKEELGKEQEKKQQERIEKEPKKENENENKNKNKEQIKEESKNENAKQQESKKGNGNKE